MIPEGEGTLRIAGEHLALRAGDTVFVPPARSTRTRSSTPRTRRSRHLSISTRDEPEIVVYPDSAKYPPTAATARLRASGASTVPGTTSTTGTGSPEPARPVAYTPSSSTSNISVAFGGITPPAPRAP